MQIFKYHTFSKSVYRDRAFTFVFFKYYFFTFASLCGTLSRVYPLSIVESIFTTRRFVKMKQVVFYTFKWRLRCSLNITRTTARVNYRGGYNSYLNANKSYARSDVDVYASNKQTCIVIGAESARPNWQLIGRCRDNHRK